MEGKMNAAMYRHILDEMLLQNALDLRVGQRFVFQQDNNPKCTANQRSGFRTTEGCEYLQYVHVISEFLIFNKCNPSIHPLWSKAVT